MADRTDRLARLERELPGAGALVVEYLHIGVRTHRQKVKA